MNKPTYEELERALVISTLLAAENSLEYDLQEPAQAFFDSLTEEDFRRTAEVVNAVSPKFFMVLEQ